MASSANILRTVTLSSCLSVLLGGALRGQEVEPRLDRLTPAYVRDLVDRSIAEATPLLEQILAVRGTRTVENTLRPYDDLLIHFNAVQIVGLLAVVHPDSAVRAAAAEGTRRRGAFQAARRLNPQLYRALAAIDTAAADAETRYYLARLLAEFRRDGVGARADARERLEAAAGRRVQLVGLAEAKASPLLLADILRDGRVLVDRDGEWRKLKRRERAIQQQAREADRRLDEEAWAALEHLDSE